GGAGGRRAHPERGRDAAAAAVPDQPLRADEGDGGEAGGGRQLPGAGDGGGAAEVHLGEGRHHRAPGADQGGEGGAVRVDRRRAVPDVDVPRAERGGGVRPGGGEGE